MQPLPGLLRGPQPPARASAILARPRTRPRRSRPPLRPGSRPTAARSGSGRARPRSPTHASSSGLDILAGEDPLDFVVQRALVVDERVGDLPRALEQLAVRAQAREPEIRDARLPRAEELALAADLEILVRELEAVGRRDERFEPRQRRVGQLLLRARDE